MPIKQFATSSNTDECCRTFIFEGEGHTLGNALRCVISGNPDVEFCGYSVPHPMEATMHFRIQMKTGKAVEALKKGLQDLVAVSDIMLEKFEAEKKSFNRLSST